MGMVHGPSCLPFELCLHVAFNLPLLSRPILPQSPVPVQSQVLKTAPCSRLLAAPTCALPLLLRKGHCRCL